MRAQRKKQPRRGAEQISKKMVNMAQPEETTAKNAQVKHYHGHRKRLRERYIKAGVSGLADYEFVELLLTLAIPRLDVKERAKALIKQFGNLRGILDAPLEDLRKVEGIGEVAPVAIKIVKGAASVYMLQMSQDDSEHADASKLIDMWRMRLGTLRNEVFEVAYLDSGNRLLKDGVERLEEGTVDRATVYPRKVIEAALRNQAAGVILAHNHPNGNVEPSEKDKLLTRALVLSAESVGLRIIDHLVVSAKDCFSFKKEGLL